MRGAKGGGLKLGRRALVRDKDDNLIAAPEKRWRRRRGGGMPQTLLLASKPNWKESQRVARGGPLTGDHQESAHFFCGIAS
jgi:hypothetical protein